MAREPVRYAELHSPHFHITGEKSAVSLGEKLDTRRKRDLKLEWDEERRKLFVTLDGEEMWVPENNIRSVSVGKFADKPIEIPHTPRPGTKVQAQVGSPQSHVFAGAGHGKTK